MRTLSCGAILELLLLCSIFISDPDTLISCYHVALLFCVIVAAGFGLLFGWISDNVGGRICVSFQ